MSFIIINTHCFFSAQCINGLHELCVVVLVFNIEVERRTAGCRNDNNTILNIVR